MKNAIWWSVQKHKLLNALYDCPRFDSGSGTVLEAKCRGSEFFAYTPLDWSKSYIVSAGDGVGESRKPRQQCWFSSDSTSVHHGLLGERLCTAALTAHARAAKTTSSGRPPSRSSARPVCKAIS